jgi:hypothetical protein
MSTATRTQPETATVRSAEQIQQTSGGKPYSEADIAEIQRQESHGTQQA